jgi:PTS system fructose-specific IIC component
MIGFDMGGPINKIAGATATALIQIDPRLLGAVEAAIPIAPLGCAFASLVIGRRLFNEQERALGASALGLGFFGISEGSIPFFSNRPKKTLIPNIIGSAIAGGLAFLFFIGGHVGMWGGPIVAFVLGIHADPGQVGTVVPSIFGGGDSTLWNYFGNII